MASDYFPSDCSRILLSVSFLPAQTASIGGVVADQTNAIMLGVRIVMTNLDTGLHLEAQTNEEGHYTVPLLPVGRYKVEGIRSELMRLIVYQVRVSV
jgi:hypothetical protein